MSNDQNFPDRLRAFRQHSGITQTELAQLLDVSRNYVSMLELGNREPSKKLARRFEELWQQQRPEGVAPDSDSVELSPSEMPAAREALARQTAQPMSTAADEGEISARLSPALREQLGLSAPTLAGLAAYSADLTKLLAARPADPRELDRIADSLRTLAESCEAAAESLRAAVPQPVPLRPLTQPVNLPRPTRRHRQ